MRNMKLKAVSLNLPVFLAQQASEKAVKAVFQKIGIEAFGHSVAGLIKKTF